MECMLFICMLSVSLIFTYRSSLISKRVEIRTFQLLQSSPAKSIFTRPCVETLAFGALWTRGHYPVFTGVTMSSTLLMSTANTQSFVAPCQQLKSQHLQSNTHHNSTTKTESTLRIQNVQHLDYGKYHCEMENSQGIATANRTLSEGSNA